ncbi:MAG: hypothetical protein PHI89_01895 [Thiovulaceae bacterium]|nr:hypothetical protein [Sulfurimonadaceae bacterium]MDD3816822.1 hypothetical protein [Sulfurimonadaceae bacterium]
MKISFEQQWLEYDYNPFLLFSSSGKILSLNTEAQFLLGSTGASEIFELATSYANVTFGFKTTFLELEFGRYKFFGLTVGYENEEEIGIKLYRMPSLKLENPKPNGQLVNIYTLIDLCISTNSISTKIDFIKDFDPAIPEIITNSNNIIKILNKSYACFLQSDTIKTRVFFRVGEHIIFENEKYPIFSIEISGEKSSEKAMNELKLFSLNTNFYIDVQKGITINIPMITR